jgi:hypothetical protein
MNDVTKSFHAYRASSESALAVLVPLLGWLRTHHADAAAEGRPMGRGIPHNLRAMLRDIPAALGSLSDDPAMPPGAEAVRGAVRRVLQIWDANMLPDGTCAALPDFARELAFLDEAPYPEWADGGASRVAFQQDYWAFYRAARAQNPADPETAQAPAGLAP